LAACTFKYVAVLQKTASKSLLEMLQKHQNIVTEISVFTQKFPANKPEI
jgi:hypothetical protein